MQKSKKDQIFLASKNGNRCHFRLVLGPAFKKKTRRFGFPVGTFGLFQSAYVEHSYSKKFDEKFTYSYFTAGQETDKEVADDLLHAEVVGKKHFKNFPPDK